MKAWLLVLLLCGALPALAEEGEVEVSIEEIPGKRSVLRGWLVSGEKRTPLRGVRSLEGLVSGMRVRSRVRSLKKGSSETELEVIGDPPRDTARRESAAVILLRFGEGPLAVGPELGRSASADLAAFYREASYGRLELSGAVFGPYAARRKPTCDLEDLAKEAIRQADREIDFRRVTRLLIASNLNCEYAGLGTIGKWKLKTGEGKLRLSASVVIDRYFTPSVWRHELGHNLGLHHAGAIRCPGGPAASAAVPKGSACERIEYGDFCDPMGHSSGQLNAMARVQLGWLSPAQFATAMPQAQPQEFTVTPLGAPGGVKALFLALPDEAAPTQLVFEYRQPIGYDGQLPAPAFEGALARLVVLQRDSGALPRTLFVSFPGVSLQRGQRYAIRDGTVVETLSASPSELRLRVTSAPGGSAAR